MDIGVSAQAVIKRLNMDPTIQKLSSNSVAPDDSLQLPSVRSKSNLNRRHSITRSLESGLNCSNENLDRANSNAAYALHQSILDGRFKQVNYFLQMGLSANSRDKYGRTGLILACLCDFEDYGIQVAKLLLKYGADINMKDWRGQNVMYIACTEKRYLFFDFLVDNFSVSIDFKQKDNDGKCFSNFFLK